MSKYYVRILTEDNKVLEQVLNAENESMACYLAWERLRVVPKGTFWKISEKGFEEHQDEHDIYFSGEEVGQMIAWNKKNRKDS